MYRIIAASFGTAVAIALLWLAPQLGLVALAVVFTTVPPWGKTLAERAVISGIVILGAVAVIFPRAGSTQIDALTARLSFSGLALVGLLL